MVRRDNKLSRRTIILINNRLLLRKMDFIVHLFWTAIVFHSQTPLWIPILFGAIPDATSWGIFFFQMIASGKLRSTWKEARHYERSDFLKMPQWLSTLYGASHSIFSFAVVFGILTFITGEIFVPALAWGMHILFDIFTHSREFLGTPFLWPVSDWKFPGFSWGRWWFIVINWATIIFLIWYLFILKGIPVVLF